MLTRIKRLIRRVQAHPVFGYPIREAFRAGRRLRGLEEPVVAPVVKTAPAGRPERLLFVACFNPQGIPTIVENIESWLALSRFRYDLLNLWPQRQRGPLRIPDDVNLRAYDGIVVHCTVAYNIRDLWTLDEANPQKLADFRGVKVVFKQDEHYYTRHTAEWMRARGVQGIISMCRPQDARVFYPQEIVGNARLLHALPGYVSDNMLGLKYPDTAERPIDVGYRGSLQPLSFGRLSWEKREIGTRFIEVCKARGLRYDISSRPEDRILGGDWFDFLGRLKGVLGVESGASIVDFDGQVERDVQFYQAAHPDAPYEQLHAAVLARHENNAYFKGLSPRHFEAAATKTVQIMYPGDFNGIFQAGRHYLALNRDFSNLDAVLADFADPAFRRTMTARAYEEIVLNPKNQYKAFVDGVDDLLADCFDTAALR